VYFFMHAKMLKLTFYFFIFYFNILYIKVADIIKTVFYVITLKSWMGLSIIIRHTETFIQRNCLLRFCNIWCLYKHRHIACVCKTYPVYFITPVMRTDDFLNEHASRCSKNVQPSRVKNYYFNGNLYCI